MMALDVEDVLLKIKRADKHIEEFKSVLSIFRDSKPYVVSCKRDPKTRELIYYVVSAKDIPRELSVIAGDVLQNLRSALDYLICAMVVANGGKLTDHTGFPIFKQVPTTKDQRATFARKIDGMGGAAKDLVRQIKPYKGLDDTLWRLHALNNRDKHRLLLTVATSIRPWNVGEHLRNTQNLKGWVPDFLVAPRDRIFPLKAGTQLLVDPPDSKENKNIKLVFDVAIDEPGIVAGEPVIALLLLFRNRVSSLVASFAALP